MIPERPPGHKELMSKMRVLQAHIFGIVIVRAYGVTMLVEFDTETFLPKRVILNTHAPLWLAYALKNKASAAFCEQIAHHIPRRHAACNPRPLLTLTSPT